MPQAGFFDLDERFRKLDEKDPLIHLDKLIFWEAFRPTLKEMRKTKRKSNAGRKLNQLYECCDQVYIEDGVSSICKNRPVYSEVIC